jgi:hypothetical protein
MGPLLHQPAHAAGESFAQLHAKLCNITRLPVLEISH